MWNYRHLTIRSKLMLAMMATCVISLILAGLLFIIAGYRFSRQNAIANLATEAKMMAESCQASVLFDDPEDAAKNLSALRSEPSIVYAAVHIEGDKDFASYYKDESYKALKPPHSHDRENGYEIKQGFLIFYHRVLNEGERIATVSLCSDLKPLKAMLLKNSVMVLTILTGISLMAYLLSLRLQRFISQPILDLTDVARKVTADKNYSIRAAKNSDDEIGVLIDSFNEMLDQIDAHKHQLIAMNEQLEEKVNERTAKLTMEITDRKKIEKQLRESEERYRKQFDGAIDAMFLANCKTGLLTDCNQAALRLVGRQKEEIIGRPQTILHPAESLDDDFSRTFKMYVQLNEGTVLEEKVITRDGQIKDVAIKANILEIGGEKILQGIFRDITENKQKEKELQKTQDELIEVSRRAGMAEVATDVLHNVGNILNSINVSTTLISDALINSEVPNLKKVADMIEANQQDLNTFFTRDPKGRYIPSYLIKAAKLLAGEQENVIGKLSTLLDDVNHIKTVIKMQQEYARVAGVEVLMTIDHVIEDAIRINLEGLKRNKIRIVRDYADLGEVTLDKQRVIQILVNLIGNTKYALSESQNPEKILKIRSYLPDESHLRIEVIDNGVGIPQENLIKVFRHGFTTKKDGHGFGLHGGALAAKEMHGSLTVCSAGTGHGATFMLELPFKPAGAIPCKTKM